MLHVDSVSNSGTSTRQEYNVFNYNRSLFFNGKGLFLTAYVDDLDIFGIDEAALISLKAEFVEEFDMTNYGEFQKTLRFRTTFSEKEFRQVIIATSVDTAENLANLLLRPATSYIQIPDQELRYN